MLLIYYGQTKILEDDIVLDKGMGTDKQAYRAIFEPGMDLPAGLDAGRTGQEGALDGSVRQVPANIGIVLLGQHLGRGHDAGLVTVVYRQKATQDRHQSLSRADIAL